MDEQKQLEDRWRELDELLGLGAAAPAPKVEKLPEPPPPPPMAREMPAVPEHQPRIEEKEQAESPEDPMQPQAEWEAEFDDDADTEVMDQDTFESLPVQPTAETSEPGEPGEQPIGEGDDKPRKGRRRRRRGRRRGPEDGEGSAPPRDAAQPQDRPPQREPAGAPRDQQPRGRQGGRPRDDDDQRRRKPAPAPHLDVVPVDDDHVQDDAPPVMHRPLAVDDTDFSDWDVPSWQDLIGSLYRPDR